MWFAIDLKLGVENLVLPLMMMRSDAAELEWMRGSMKIVELGRLKFVGIEQSFVCFVSFSLLSNIRKGDERK